MLFKGNAAPDNSPSVDEIIIHDLAALEGMDGGIPPGDMVKGRYVITRYQAALSRTGLSVKPGDVFVFETDVRLERMTLAAEKPASPFLVGPIFYDAKGEVVQWLQLRPAPAKAERIVIRAKAPENAATGRLGFCGPWEADGTATDYVISFGPTQLQRDDSVKEASNCAENPDARIAAEVDYFRNMDLNALPEIHCYWANKHLIGYLAEAFGVGDIFDIFAKELRDSIEATGNPLIISIGAGDCEIEVETAARMIAGGFTRFSFECLELSPFLIERGNARIKERRLERHISFTETNLAHWRLERKFGAAFANQSLHHIEALEHVFDMIGKGLEPRGSFVVSDMIGRNGHMRWPESLAIINAVWSVIPDHWKHNRPLARFEETFVNHDCSTHGFEGIRAQDILPLLLERFQFHRFATWGGLLDPFVDRAFGHNLSSQNPFDRKFIDALWETNQAPIKLGVLTPTQMVAVMKRRVHSSARRGSIQQSACGDASLIRETKLATTTSTTSRGTR
jgi:SAM-dependent methyltransferase